MIGLEPLEFKATARQPSGKPGEQRGSLTGVAHMSLEVRVEKESRVMGAVMVEAIRISWFMQKSNSEMLRNTCV